MRTGGSERPRLGDRLRVASLGGFVGREGELAAILEPGEPAPVVTFVHGMGGIGKSALLDVVCHRLVERGERVARLDGRSVEPSARGFLEALGSALGGAPCGNVAELEGRLDRAASLPFIVVDEVDRLHLIDGWLRQTLLPALPIGVRWLFAGRLAPESAWVASPGWTDAVRTLRLGPLGDAEARELLARRGVAQQAMPPLLELAHGSPLALDLGARSASRGSAMPTVDVVSVFDALARRCIHDMEADLRASVEAGCVVRRVTRPLLEAMLGRPCDDAFMASFAELPFVERTEDGLAVHEAVRQAVRSRLASLDPPRLAALRSGAWRYYEACLRAVPDQRWTWRAAADVLYLIESPVVREAFFPSATLASSVDSAREADERTLFDIAAAREPSNLPALRAWWQHAREAFRVVREGSGRVRGFGVFSWSWEVPQAVLAEDALLREWTAHLHEGPGGDRGAFFVRHIVSEGVEDASDVSAPLGIDAKRAYVEQPRLWAVYAATRNPEGALTQLESCGYRRGALSAGAGALAEHTVLLVFGEAGIWTWLSRLVAAGGQGPRGAPAATVSDPDRGPIALDEAARALRLDGAEVALSALEYAVLVELVRAEGAVVTRDALLDSVWRQRYAGSNVVDAVIRLLRKKLGDHADALETVRGHGYRLHLSPAAPAGKGKARAS